MDNVRVVTISAIFRSLSYSTIWIFSSIYVTTFLGMPVIFASVLFFAGGLVSSVSQVAGGKIGDRVGHRNTYVFSLGAISIMMLMLSSLRFISESFENYFIFIVLLMALNSFLSPSSNSLVSNSSAVQLKGFSIIRVGNNVGWGLGPAIGGYIINASGFESLFVYCFYMSFLSFIISLFVTGVQIKEERKIIFKTSNLSLILLSFGALLLFMVQAQETVTLSIFSDRILSGNYGNIGLIYMTNGIFVIILQPFMYKVSTRIGSYFSLLIGSFIYTTGYLSYGFDSSLINLILSTILLTFGEDLAFPAGYAIVAEISRKDRIGTNMGIYNAFMSAGRAFGPLLGGYALTNFTSPVIIWIFATVPGFISCILLIFSLGTIETYRKRFGGNLNGGDS
ncbi:MAG: MFS transporter [Candidatus Thermoplasmatota archaeon]|jgi:MFS family permease|nr:MFS transporter [Candidatus Thermoplasmatota archaeon]